MKVSAVASASAYTLCMEKAFCNLAGYGNTTKAFSHSNVRSFVGLCMYVVISSQVVVEGDGGVRCIFIAKVDVGTFFHPCIYVCSMQMLGSVMRRIYTTVVPISSFCFPSYQFALFHLHANSTFA